MLTAVLLCVSIDVDGHPTFEHFFLDAAVFRIRTLGFSIRRNVAGGLHWDIRGTDFWGYAATARIAKLCLDKKLPIQSVYFTAKLWFNFF